MAQNELNSSQCQVIWVKIAWPYVLKSDVISIVRPHGNILKSDSEKTAHLLAHLQEAENRQF